MAWKECRSEHSKIIDALGQCRKKIVAQEPSINGNCCLPDSTFSVKPVVCTTIIIAWIPLNSVTILLMFISTFFYNIMTEMHIGLRRDCQFVA